MHWVIGIAPDAFDGAPHGGFERSARRQLAWMPRIKCDIPPLHDLLPWLGCGLCSRGRFISPAHANDGISGRPFCPSGYTSLSVVLARILRSSLATHSNG
jgi:hypothetical protein